MVRSITLGACVLILSLASVTAKEVERGRSAAEISATAAEESRREGGVESIAEEAAEVGEEGSETDGMSRTEDEMIRSEDDDGCTGSIGNEDFLGCDNGPAE